MARLCERPTCSQPADVTYGIDPYELVVTLEAFDDERSRRAGVLCRDHADSMVVPNGWSLDDRREATPRLFQSRESAKVKPRRRIRRRRLTDDDTGQLRLAVNFTDNADDGSGDGRAEVIELNKPRSRASGLAPWQPVFDQTDDLDGLLSARSPLLSRAFGKEKKSRSAKHDATAEDTRDGARPAAPEGRKGERRSKGPRAV